MWTWIYFVFMGLIFAAAAHAVAVIYLAVHQGLECLCLWHAARHCRRRGLDPKRLATRFARDADGFKTEATDFELECHDAAGCQTIVYLRVWPWGPVRPLHPD
jgi:hypothetical protein